MSTRNPNSSSLVPSFREVRKLGEGSYGQIWQVEHNGRKYVRKTVSMQQPFSTMMEISLYTMMSHPNIMESYYYIPSSDYLTVDIIMEEAEATLRTQFLESGSTPIDESEVRLLMRQLLSALEYLHFNNILHLDLKPDNILMDNMFLKVIDFGIAQYLYPGLRGQGIAQTYTYRAPEVFRQELFGTAADMWSAGLIMFALVGKREYYRGREGLVRDLVLNNHAQLIGDINNLNCSDACKDLLRLLLAFNPEDRISAKDALEHPWFSGMPYNGPEKIPLRVAVGATYPGLDNPQYLESLRRARIPVGAYQLAKHMTMQMKDLTLTDNVKNATLALAAILLYAKAPYDLPVMIGTNPMTSASAKMLLDILQSMGWNMIVA